MSGFLKQNKGLNWPKYLVGLFVMLFVLLAHPMAVYANNGDPYEQMNIILYVALGLGGFMVLFSIIMAGIKLSTAQSNPANRTQGILGLVFALLGGYMVYKSMDIAGYLSSWFGL